MSFLPSRRQHGRRNLWMRGFLRLFGGFAGVLALGCGAFALDREFDEARAIKALQEGGYVVYLRHADRYKGPKEALNQHSSPAAFADCSNQRNLTPKGRAQAQALGRYFRELSISFDRVVANAQCRTRDTAMLALGHVQLDPRIYDPVFVRDILSTPRGDGANTLLVGNDYQFDTLTGIELGRAEAAIVRPDAMGGFQLVARLDLNDWREAAEPGWW